MKEIRESKESKKSILLKSAVTIVVISAFLAYYAQLPETGAYFTTRVVSDEFTTVIR
jgi:hypothetical protein